MLSPKSFTEIKDRINRNDEKISLLEAINTVLKERHEIETNYKSLSLKFTKLQKEETERRQEYDQTRKAYLMEVENKGAEFCKEHTRLAHQVEHLQWHLEGCSKHKPCGTSQTQLHESSTTKKPSTSTTMSCQSSTATSVCRPSYMTTPEPKEKPSRMAITDKHEKQEKQTFANLRNTSERLIKSIIDLRKKIYVVENKLEHEIKRKREMEKKLSDMRKDISRNKKLLTMRRSTTPLPQSLPPLKNKCSVK